MYKDDLQYCFVKCLYYFTLYKLCIFMCHLFYMLLFLTHFWNHGMYLCTTGIYVCMYVCMYVCKLSPHTADSFDQFFDYFTRRIPSQYVCVVNM